MDNSFPSLSEVSKNNYWNKKPKKDSYDKQTKEKKTEFNELTYNEKCEENFIKLVEYIKKDNYLKIFYNDKNTIIFNISDCEEFNTVKIIFNINTVTIRLFNFSTQIKCKYNDKCIIFSILMEKDFAKILDEVKKIHKLKNLVNM
jgi:hypothetical protein